MLLLCVCVVLFSEEHGRAQRLSVFVNRDTDKHDFAHHYVALYDNVNANSRHSRELQVSTFSESIRSEKHQRRNFAAKSRNFQQKLLKLLPLIALPMCYYSACCLSKRNKD